MMIIKKNCPRNRVRYTANHDYTRVSIPLVKIPIRLGARSWIGADVFIGPRVTIGEGAVVGARSLVVRDIEPWVVAAGHPARILRPRTFVDDLNLL